MLNLTYKPFVLSVIMLSVVRLNVVMHYAECRGAVIGVPRVLKSFDLFTF
jgi:hypothetical protein